MLKRRLEDICIFKYPKGFDNHSCYDYISFLEGECIKVKLTKEFFDDIRHLVDFKQDRQNLLEIENINYLVRKEMIKRNLTSDTDKEFYLYFRYVDLIDGNKIRVEPCDPF